MSLMAVASGTIVTEPKVYENDDDSQNILFSLKFRGGKGGEAADNLVYVNFCPMQSKVGQYLRKGTIVMLSKAYITTKVINDKPSIVLHVYGSSLEILRFTNEDEYKENTSKPLKPKEEEQEFPIPTDDIDPF